MQKENQTSKFNDLSLKDKGHSLHRALYNLLNTYELFRRSKDALMKSICQTFIDDEAIFVCNKKRKENFIFSIYYIYEFLDDLEQSGITCNDLDSIILKKDLEVE